MVDALRHNGRMNKRDFVTGAAVAALLPAAQASAATPPPRPGFAPGLLTVSGLVGHSNRGPLDPALDQLMGKHAIRFERAWVFDALALGKLPAVQIRPTLEYDARVHTLSGPLLTTVLAAARVPEQPGLSLVLRALDGYGAPLSVADARAYRMIVATHLDGQPLALGGLGPQWAVYDADRLPAFSDRPLKERFALCPWGLYSIEVARTA